MPSVTQPPVIIDNAQPARDDAIGSHYFGPYIFGANLYTVLANQPNFNGLSVYKSTDNGATWTSMDSANRPASGIGAFDVIINGTVLHLVYNSTRLVMNTFDTATDTWGAVGPNGDNGFHPRMVQFGNGDFCVLYDQFSSAEVAVVINSGGVWGVPTTIPNPNASTLFPILGPDNIARLFYNDLLAPGINVFMRTFTQGGVLGAEQPVFSSSFVANQVLEGALPVGRGVVWNNKLVLPYYGVPTGSGKKPGVYLGDPYTAPVWSFLPAGAPFLTPAEIDGDAYAFVDNSNNLILFWNAVDDPILDSVYYAINAGAGFAVPVVYYDEVTNPPANSASPQFLHTLAATRSADGSKFLVITAMEEGHNPFTGRPFCAGYFLLGNAQPVKKCLQ